MKVMQVHSYFRYRGGVETVVEATVELLRRRGVEVSLFSRDSRARSADPARALLRFAGSLYSVRAYRAMERTLRRRRPDVVHVHNLYPLLSPSVLSAARRAGVPVVMTCHSYDWECAAPVLTVGREDCDHCGDGREYMCVLRNCAGNLAASAAFAVRRTAVRRLRLIRDNVTLFVALSEFARERMVRAGLPEERIETVPNMVSLRRPPADPAAGRYVAYAGRLALEKGIETLLEAMAGLPRIPLRLAGAGPARERLVRRAPPNAQFAGWLGPAALGAFYRGARVLVLPGRCFELHPMCVAEAMSYGLPTVLTPSANCAGLVEDGVSGLICRQDDPRDLARKVAALWDDVDLCRRMGQAARQRAERDMGEDLYFDRIMGAYGRAIALCGRGREPVPTEAGSRS